MYTVDPESLRAARDLARTFGVPLLTHLAETRDEVKESMEKHHLSPAAYFESSASGTRRRWPPTVCTCRRRTSPSREAPRRAVAQPREQHEAGERGRAGGEALRAGSPSASGPTGRRAQRPRHVRAMRQAAFLHKLSDGDPTAASAQTVLEIGHARRRGGRRHGRPARFARGRQAGGPDRGLDAVGAPDADVQPRLAPRLRLARRRRAHGDRERPRRHARPPRADAEPAVVLADARRLAAKVRAAVETAPLSRACEVGQVAGTARRSRARSRRRNGPRS